MCKVSDHTVVFDVVGTLFSLDAPRRLLTDGGAPAHALDLWFAESLRDYFARSHASRYVALRKVLEAELPRTLRSLRIGPPKGSSIRPSEALAPSMLNPELGKAARRSPRPDGGYSLLQTAAQR
jgi:2-haloacid dehalogenase